MEFMGHEESPEDDNKAEGDSGMPSVPGDNR